MFDAIHKLFNTPAIRKVLVKARVPLAALVVLAIVYKMDPAWLLPGFLVSMFGEFIQLWCFASLDKGRTLAFNGPYAFVRNPMYLGRFFIVLGGIMLLLLELIYKKQKPVLIIDEASLLRMDVFAELHTLAQFEGDSKPVLPLILAGQNNLTDNLMFRQSRPLASRVVARGHMESLKSDEMADYLQHHLSVAGCKQNLFPEQAVTAIHQGSGGLLRRANNPARGALLAAASEKCQIVAAVHVRIASTEII